MNRTRTFQTVMLILVIMGTGPVWQAAAQTDTPSITVTAPIAGDFWAVGTTKAITWTTVMLTGDVEIRLYDYNTSSPSYGTFVLLVSGIPASQDSWDWAIPADQTLGAQYRIRIVGTGVSSLSGAYLEIGANDTVAPTVTVNQTADQPDPAPIPVSTADLISAVQFDVLFSEPVTGFTIDDVSWAGSTATGITADLVVLPLGTPDGKTFKIRVLSSSTGTLVASIPAGVCMDLARNPNEASTSTDNVVTVAGPAPTSFVITSPAAGAYWVLGTTQTITWDGTLLTGKASIRLYNYDRLSPNYASYEVLAEAVPAVQGSFTWTVPADLANGANYRVRVLAAEAQGKPSAVTGDFSIGPEGGLGCTGCSSCSKSGVQKSLGDFFLAGLSLSMLAAFSLRNKKAD
jgi:hypothetical protein